MQVVTLRYTDNLPMALGKRPPDAAREIQLMAALKLFECGRLSSGMAAELAAMSRVEFLLECGRYGVSVFQQTGEELQEDAANAAEARRR